ncbi:ABC transporter ATP-binding protein (plasmid) [Bosea vestrisii]|uniref:ABC transporter ATP-binding protein n=1 Tax=Bosea vestrisii TaxID=151416 RepID=UPI0024DF3EDE|nr:ABC transporter ATP-binding protein [Bosea vestrisii]WID99929.1 ABC transporter ATP-binding protein [Bosea vestrisii]
MTLLDIRNLSLRSDRGVPILRSVSLSLEPGQVVALIGASGSGKTTLALSVLGLLRPGIVQEAGEILYKGRDILRMKAGELNSLRGRELSYIAQSAATSFNPRIRLEQQVTESSRIHRTMTQAEARGRAEAMYRTLDLPETAGFSARYPHEVSGGQLQRFMIAMGLQERPDVLVCDEPTSALDATTQVEVLKALKSGIGANRTAAILVGHDIAQVVQVATHVLVMRQGVVVEEGSVDDILNRPAHDYTQALLHMHRRFDPARRPVGAGRSGAAPLLEVRNLGVNYASRHGSAGISALRGASMRLHRGEMIAVIGESGSGKSTFARAVAGLTAASEGEVILDGVPVAGDVRSRSQATRKAIQITFQSADTSLNRHHTVGRILGRVLEFYGETSKGRRDARIAELLECVQLPAHYVSRKPSQLSGGEKQRVNLARSLAADPDVLICDEITSALDNIVSDAVLRLIDDLKIRLDIGVIFISHDLSAVASMSDKIMVLRGGDVVEHGATSEVLGDPQHPYTALLRSSVAELRVGWLEEAAGLHRELRANLEAPAGAIRS